MINAIPNSNPISNFIDNLKSKPISNNNYTAVSTSYKSDAFTLNTNITKPIPTDPPYQEPVPYKPSFFDRPEVRIGGMMLGAGAVGGGIGYAVGSAFGRASLGTAIGTGVGVTAPIALLAYALYSWGKNN
ncbi:MAG: hypothetical protein U0457_10865 [Candidatus Sericytochromatia bacterium]